MHASEAYTRATRPKLLNVLLTHHPDVEELTSPRPPLSRLRRLPPHSNGDIGALAIQYDEQDTPVLVGLFARPRKVSRVFPRRHVFVRLSAAHSFLPAARFGVSRISARLHQFSAPPNTPTPSPSPSSSRSVPVGAVAGGSAAAVVLAVVAACACVVLRRRRQRRHEEPPELPARLHGDMHAATPATTFPPRRAKGPGAVAADPCAFAMNRATTATGGLPTPTAMASVHSGTRTQAISGGGTDRWAERGDLGRAAVAAPMALTPSSHLRGTPDEYESDHTMSESGGSFATSFPTMSSPMQAVLLVPSTPVGGAVGASGATEYSPSPQAYSTASGYSPVASGALAARGGGEGAL